MNVDMASGPNRDSFAGDSSDIRMGIKGIGIECAESCRMMYLGQAQF